MCYTHGRPRLLLVGKKDGDNVCAAPSRHDSRRRQARQHPLRTRHVQALRLRGPIKHHRQLHERRAGQGLAAADPQPRQRRARSGHVGDGGPGETPYAELHDSLQVFSRVFSRLPPAIWTDTTGFDPCAVASVECLIRAPVDALGASRELQGLLTQIALFYS